MDLRRRVLECLQEYAGDDEPPFEQLVERLMVALVQKSQEIKKLEEADAHEYLQAERRKLRNDPLYGAQGDYYWIDARSPTDRLHYCVRIRGSHIEMFRRDNTIDWVVMRVTAEEWHKNS